MIGPEWVDPPSWHHGVRWDERGVDVVLLGHETARTLENLVGHLVEKDNAASRNDLVADTFNRLKESLEARRRVKESCTRCMAGDPVQRFRGDFLVPFRFCERCWGVFDKWADREYVARRNAEQATSEAAREDECVVYCLLRGDGLVKIGFSSQFERRLASLQRDHGELEVIGTVPGGRDRERQMHRRFHQARVRGEWFRFTPAIRQAFTTVDGETEVAA